MSGVLDRLRAWRSSEARQRRKHKRRLAREQTNAEVDAQRAAQGPRPQDLWPRPDDKR